MYGRQHMRIHKQLLIELSYGNYFLSKIVKLRVKLLVDV